jgi:hypothetical protein
MTCLIQLPNLILICEKDQLNSRQLVFFCLNDKRSEQFFPCSLNRKSCETKTL